MKFSKVTCPNCNREATVFGNAQTVKCKHCGCDIVVGNNIDVPSRKVANVFIVLIIILAIAYMLFRIKNSVVENERYNNYSNSNSGNEVENINGDDNIPEVNVNNVYDYEASLSDIKKEKGKVNIYMFWGNGCPHCADAHEFFDSIKNKYGSMFNLYGFEVWYNSDNSNLANKFASAMGDELAGVPYYIIGSKSFPGYASSWDNDIINAIKEESKKDFDVYFDKVKKKTK